MKDFLKKIGIGRLWRYLNTTYLEQVLRSLEDVYRMASTFGFLKSIELTTKMRWGSPKQVTSFYLSGYRFPIYSRRGNSDFGIFKQVFLNQEYNYSCSKPEYIVDAGAHCGFATIYFAHKFQNLHSIVAIEPELSNYALLLLNTHNYDCVTTVNKAIWSHSKGVYLDKQSDNYCAFQANELAKDATSEIGSISLQELVSEFSLKDYGVFKIDIEGSEKEIFKNENASWLREPSIVFVEPHDRFGFAVGGDSMIRERAREYGFSVHDYGENIVLNRD